MTPVAIITGASRGIGAATARMAAASGYAVCVNYRRDRAAAERVAGDIAAAGGRAIAVAADVAVEADVVRLFETCDGALGPLTALVNNAGILETRMRVEAMDFRCPLCRMNLKQRKLSQAIVARRPSRA